MPSGTNESKNGQKPCINLKKIKRQGCNIHCVDVEEVKNFKKFSEKIPTDDRIDSGESLYKTFSFEQGNNKSEIEKCIEFWKSVTEKNLRPVKCSIIETQLNEKSQSLCECTESVEKVSKRKVAGKRTTRKDKETPEITTNKWLDIMKELQRKKLDKIKLIVQKQNEMVDTIKDCGIESTQDNEKIKQEIVALNSWRPKSKSLKKEHSSTSKPSDIESGKENTDVNDDLSSENITTETIKQREWCSICGKDLCVCLKCDKYHCQDMGFHEQMREISKLNLNENQSKSILKQQKNIVPKTVKYDVESESSADNVLVNNKHRQDVWDSMIASEHYDAEINKTCNCGYNDCDCTPKCCDCGNEYCRCKIGGYNLFSEFGECCQSAPAYDKNITTKLNIKDGVTENPQKTLYHHDKSVQCEIEEFKENKPPNGKYCIICDHYGCGCQNHYIH